MLSYYFNLPKDNVPDFDTNINKSYAILKASEEAFKPFEFYLRNAIKALERKENVKAKWKKIKNENTAELKIIGGLYEISKQTQFKVLHNEKGYYRITSKIDEPDFNEKLRFKAGNNKGEVQVDPALFQKRLIKLPITVSRFDNVIWGYDSIELKPAWAEFQKGDSVFIDNSETRILDMDAEKITVAGDFKNGTLKHNGIELQIEVLNHQNSNSSNQNIIREDDKRTIVYSDKHLPQGAKIPEHKLVSFIDFENLILENGKKLEATRNDGLGITLNHSDDYGKIVTSGKLKFKIEHLRKNSKDAFWIQLLENDESEGDDIPGYSPLRYFFDDDVSITDDKKNEYKVVAGIESENKIVLKRRVEKEEKGRSRSYWEFCFPPENSTLTVRVNTYPLRKQLESIGTLRTMPQGEHYKLIKLFENRERVRWQRPSSEEITDWVVIKDNKRSGCAEQRQFVNQALNTPDFAILEGPPGSGKTTVILELICQLARLGKRVLLCGSTHVAIDNVLERLKEKRAGEPSLLEKFHILPVRIGDEKRINDDIKEFQINNLINDNQIDENLLLDAANLVCGTTIGILQHPRFKERSEKGKYWREIPVMPEFDYLIIDESSKTTFQEFLVPALYAKKWILAGDVMQLSPFTEREEVVSNIENLTVAGKELDANLQQAVFYLYKLKDSLFGKYNRFVLPAPIGVIKEMLNELLSGRQKDFANKLMLFITKDLGAGIEGNGHIFLKNVSSVTRLELAALDLIIIEDTQLEKILMLMPESHALLRNNKWMESEHAFIHNGYQLQYEFSYRNRGRRLTNSFEIAQLINNQFIEKNWAEEIAWRIDREHQLRMIEKSKLKGNYGKAILELIPKSLNREEVEQQINQIASIAFPSILESLVKGIAGRKSKLPSTISEGFNQAELESRKTTLVYQQRMHPEISRFPRERFYKSENALLDLERPKHIESLRQWNYNKYSQRCVWVDVEGKTIKNYNKEEVDMLMQHLKEFIEYAKHHHQPEGKEWTVACLTFYRGQENKIREKLQALTGNENGFSNFNITAGKEKISIKLHTVDKFQGHEADVVFLSMVQTERDGFMDNPNRLNVAITRAKFQLVIIGKQSYFLNRSQSEDLKALAQQVNKQN